MFSWMSSGGSSSGSEKKKGAGGSDVFDTVVESLKRAYRLRLLPLEEAYEFGAFHSPPLSDADFDAKPMVLLVGQYSTGKTTFIRYLIEQDYPGIRIGPEPTTDKFIAVCTFASPHSPFLHPLPSPRCPPM